MFLTYIIKTFHILVNGINKFVLDIPSYPIFIIFCVKINIFLTNQGTNAPQTKIKYICFDFVQLLINIILKSNMLIE